MRLPTIFLCLSIVFDLYGSNSDIDKMHNQIYAIMDNHVDSAMILADRALRDSEGSYYTWGVANSYYIKGYLFDKQNQLVESLLMYLKSAHELEEHSSRSQKMNETLVAVYLNIGAALWQHRKFDESIEFYDKGLNICQTEDYLASKALKLFYNKALAYQDKGDLVNALSTLQTAFNASLKLKDDVRKLKCLNLMGIIHREKKDFVKARNYYQLILNDEKATSRNLAQANHNIAITYQEELRFDEAITFYLKSYSLKQSIEDQALMFTTLKGLVEVYNHQGNYKTSINIGKDALEILPHLVTKPENYDLYQHLQLAYYNTKRPIEAQKHALNYFRASKEFNRKQKELIQLKDQFEMDLLLSGFYNEIQTARNKAIAKYWIVGFSLFLLLLLLLALFVQKQRFKMSVQEQLMKILTESNV